MFLRNFALVLAGLTVSLNAFATPPVLTGTGKDAVRWLTKEFARTRSGDSKFGRIETNATGEDCAMGYEKLSSGAYRFFIIENNTGNSISVDLSPSERSEYRVFDAGAQYSIETTFPQNDIDELYLEFDEPSYYFRATLQRGDTTATCFFEG